MTQTSNNENKPWENANVLYEDDCVKLTRSQMEIKRYYFPIMTSKVIDLNQIKGAAVIDVLRPDSPVEKFSWGPQFVFKELFMRWWPLDASRQGRGAVLEFQLANAKYVKPALTCDNMPLLIKHLKTLINKDKP